MEKRYWRLVLKWFKLPDEADLEWMEEHLINGKPEEYVDEYNVNLEPPGKPIELIAAIPIKAPTGGSQ